MRDMRRAFLSLNYFKNSLKAKHSLKLKIRLKIGFKNHIGL